MNITLKSAFENFDNSPGITSHIQLELERLQEVKNQLEIAEGEREEKLTEILSPEQIIEMNSIKSYYQEILSHFSDQASSIETTIKHLVTDHGESVKGDTLHAVYSPPRVTWDSKGLTGYAVAHPEIEAFKKVGKPSVSIRTIKK